MPNPAAVPAPRHNRLRIFPDRHAAAAAAQQCRTPRFPKIVADTLHGPIHTVRRDTYRNRAVFSTWLCEDGRFRFLDRCDW